MPQSPQPSQPSQPSLSVAGPAPGRTPYTPIPAASSPSELVSRCVRDRRSPAWRQLVTRYGRYLEFGVRRALRRFDLSPEPALIEDLVQEAYCRLLEDEARRLRTFRGTVPAQLGAWLRRLAERTALDHLRSAAATKRGGDTRLVPHQTLEDDPSDPSACPMLRLERRERVRLFVRRCRELPGGERGLRVLRLMLGAGWSSREVARASGGTLSTSGIDSMVYRLRRRLRDEGLRLAVRH